jgi:phage FluMu gp28-like protein
MNQKLRVNDNVWWIAPVYGQAEIAFNRMRSQISNKDFFKVNESKLKLTLPTGVVIHFKSAEKPDNLYGEDVYAAVFDEFTRAREESWFALRSTLTATNGKCKLIGNVKGKKNWGYRLGVRARSGEKDYEYFKITAYDAVNAGILKLEEIEQAKRDLPEYVFNELYLAQPNDDASNPFGIDHIRKQLQTKAYPNDVHFYGVDLAKSSDYTCIVGLNQNGSIAYFERFQKDWSSTTAILKMLIGTTPALIDSTGVGDPIVEELVKVCPNAQGFKFTSESKQQIMLELATSVQKQEVSILQGVMQEEMESFEYSYSARGVRYCAPDGMHDDTVCALALANHCRLTKHINKVILFR